MQSARNARHLANRRGTGKGHRPSSQSCRIQRHCWKDSTKGTRTRQCRCRASSNNDDQQQLIIYGTTSRTTKGGGRTNERTCASKTGKTQSSWISRPDGNWGRDAYSRVDSVRPRTCTQVVAFPRPGSHTTDVAKTTCSILARPRETNDIATSTRWRPRRSSKGNRSDRRLMQSLSHVDAARTSQYDGYAACDGHE